MALSPISTATVSICNWREVFLLEEKELQVPVILYGSVPAYYSNRGGTLMIREI